MMWERHAQNSSFTSEINAIKSNTRNNPKNQLGLAIDENGILRCHERLIRENFPESTSFPKLLPKNHAFTSLVINSLHEKLMHAGVPIHCQLSEENSGYHKEEQQWEKFFWTVKDVEDIKGAHTECPRWLHTHPRARPWLSGTLVCESRQWIIDTQGVGLPIYLLSSQSSPFRTHQWHVCRAIPFMPKKIYRQAWQVETDYIWQCFTIQASKIHCW